MTFITLNEPGDSFGSPTLKIRYSGTHRGTLADVPMLSVAGHGTRPTIPAGLVSAAVDHRLAAAPCKETQKDLSHCVIASVICQEELQEGGSGCTLRAALPAIKYLPWDGRKMPTFKQQDSPE